MVSGLLALTIVVLLFRESATEALRLWTGTRTRGAAGREATGRALGIVVLVALIVALDPEVRAFLVFLDTIGVDLFVMLLLFQGREILQWLGVAMGLPAIRQLETRGWYPMPLPSCRLLKQHPWWSVYAAGRAVVMIILIALPTGALLRGLGDTLL
jgi:hypothetical protein